MTKEQVLLFVTYLQRFRREEGVRLRKAYDKAGGMFSSVGPSDGDVYDAFMLGKTIQSESMPGIFYSYDTGIEINNIDEYLKQKK